MQKVRVPNTRRTGPDTESDLMRRIRAALSGYPDVTLFRNNVGVLRDARGAFVRYGLAPGSADLIGSLRVYAGVLGSLARSLAIEVKRTGEKPTKEQQSWMDAMRSQGWLVGVCTSVEDAVELIERGRRWDL